MSPEEAHPSPSQFLPAEPRWWSERRKGVKISLESDFSPCSVSALHWWIGILSLVPGLQLIACVGLQLLLREDCSPLLKTFQHWLIPGAILSSIVPPPMLKQQWAAIKSMYFFQSSMPAGVSLHFQVILYTHVFTWIQIQIPIISALDMVRHVCIMHMILS